MSKQDKKETTFTSSSNIQNTDNYNQGNIQQNNQQSFNNTTEKRLQSLNQSLDETKKTIHKNIDETRSQIPRYTQTISDAQEQIIQATKEISDNYIEYQKEIINSLQSIFIPYIENANFNVWNSQEYFKKLPEIYSKIASNYAENTMAVNRIFNDLVFANVESFKNIINNAKGYSNHLLEIGKRNARIYEEIDRDNRETISSLNQNQSRYIS